MIASLLVLFAIGLIALVAVAVAIAVFSAIFSVVLGIVGFVAFKVAPVLLIGWLVVMLLRRSQPSEQISPSDTAWLDQ